MAGFVLTQPLGRLEPLRDALRSRGHDCYDLPFSALEPRAGGLAELARHRPEDFDHWIFVSPAAAAFAAPALSAMLHGHPGVCAIGAGTEAALRESGVLAPQQSAVMPEAPPYDADALFALIAPASRRVIVVKGEGGRTDWLDRLRGLGVELVETVVYASRPVLPQPVVADELGRALQGGARPILLLSSRSAIRALVGWPPLRPHLGALQTCRALAVHPNVEKAARVSGFSDVVLPGAGRSLAEAALALVGDDRP